MTKDNQNQDSKLTVYELAVLLDPKLSETAVAKKTTALGKIVAQESGAVLSHGEARVRNLAYVITVKNEGKRRDFDKAHFNWIKFEQLPEKLSAIETELANDLDIIRSLITKTTREDHVTTLTDEYDPEAEEFDEEDEGVEEAEEVEDEASDDE